MHLLLTFCFLSHGIVDQQVAHLARRRALASLAFPCRMYLGPPTELHSIASVIVSRGAEDELSPAEISGFARVQQAVGKRAVIAIASLATEGAVLDSAEKAAVAGEGGETGVIPTGTRRGDTCRRRNRKDRASPTSRRDRNTHRSRHITTVAPRSKSRGRCWSRSRKQRRRALCHNAVSYREQQDVITSCWGDRFSSFCSIRTPRATREEVGDGGR